MKIVFAFIISLFMFAAAAPAVYAGSVNFAEKAKHDAEMAEKKRLAAEEKERQWREEQRRNAKPSRRPMIMPAMTDDGTLIPVDTDESLLLPPYPAGARTSVGKMREYTITAEDTLLDVARFFRLGFVELRAANQEIDPWTPGIGTVVTVPAFKLLPRAEQEGVIVNLAQMRMFYFKEKGSVPVTFPIGVGREGLQTPTGVTTIERKVAGPSWFPTERMREEKPFLPISVPPGPSNPLGTHALYLGWPTFLIHGSNKPWAIGRRVSSGCMRMYPEDIKEVYNMVPTGARVAVVDQPILVAWVGDTLYLEANPSKLQGNDIEIEGEFTPKPLNDRMKRMIIAAAGVPDAEIDWLAAEKIVLERKGYPMAIAKRKTAEPVKTDNPPKL